MDCRKAIVNVQAYLPDDKEIIKIIELCNLRPIEDDWRKWQDNCGNILFIRKNKIITTIKKSVFLKKEPIITDIHFKASVDRIAKNSKFAMVSFAKSKDNKSLLQNICFIWFLSNENKLRLLVFMRNEWIENQFPLCSGIKTLRTFVKNLNCEQKVIIGPKKIRGPHPSRISRTWITKWPPNHFLIEDMKSTNPILTEIVINDCGVI